LALEKGRHIFRLLMAARPDGDFAKPPDEALRQAIAAEVGGCTPGQVFKKWENIRCRYCDTRGRLDKGCLAVRYALEAATPTAASSSSSSSSSSSGGGGGGGEPKVGVSASYLSLSKEPVT
jgi:hypothetical protein